jgi:hypothetical protein
LIGEVLRKGGWTDVDVITRADTALAKTPENPAVAVAAMQNLLAPPQ